MLFEEERFQTGSEGGETMYEKAHFPYLLSLMRGTVMRPASAERREREG